MEDAAARAAQDITERLREMTKGGRRVLVSIDGRTTAGKSTIADRIAKELPCNIVHMDDFYIHPVQRTEERYAQPGGNADYERVRREIIEPWLENGAFSYASYNAHQDSYGEVVHFPARPVTIVEGAYSAHPRLRDAYDLRIFVTTDQKTQLARVAVRNGPDAVRMFAEKWIPLEEAYLRACQVREGSDMVFET